MNNYIFSNMWYPHNYLSHYFPHDADTNILLQTNDVDARELRRKNESYIAREIRESPRAAPVLQGNGWKWSAFLPSSACAQRFQLLLCADTRLSPLNDNWHKYVCQTNSQYNRHPIHSELSRIIWQGIFCDTRHTRSESETVYWIPAIWNVISENICGRW